MLLDQVRLVLFAFAIGYLTRHFNPLNWNQIKEIILEQLGQLSPTLLASLGILGTVAALFLLLWPLEKVAEWEAQQTTDYSFRTSAREHLKRRGSF